MTAVYLRLCFRVYIPLPRESIFSMLLNHQMIMIATKAIYMPQPLEAFFHHF
jgi:hypothetical protein